MCGWKNGESLKIFKIILSEKNSNKIWSAWVWCVCTSAGLFKKKIYLFNWFPNWPEREKDLYQFKKRVFVWIILNEHVVHYTCMKFIQWTCLKKEIYFPVF